MTVKSANQAVFSRLTEAEPVLIDCGPARTVMGRREVMMDARDERLLRELHQATEAERRAPARAFTR